MQKLINLKKEYSKVFVRDITSLGGMIFYMLNLIISIIAGQYVLCKALAISLVFIFLISLSLRLVYFKPRPKKQPYQNIYERLDASSFPSIHAARITALAFIYGYVLKLSLSINIFLAIIVILVSYTRVKLKKHYLIDVVTGVVVGAISSYISLMMI